MKLDKTAMGIALGILWGAGVFLITALVLMRGGGEHLYLLGQVYIGYSVSWSGAAVGLIYGFVDGFLTGWILAWLYNRLARP